MPIRNLAHFAPVVLVMAASPVRAELPEGARGMIEAALATGDDGTISTVIELARKTWPEDEEELARIEAGWEAEKAARNAAADERMEQAIRSAGVFERWHGEGELGGFQSDGNSHSVGVSAGLKLERQGIDWSHRLRARFDYQRQNGVTSREQYFAAYEPRWQFGEDVFAYGLAQFERDRIQGVDGRYAISTGLGYKLVESDGLKLSVKAGPAYRVTEYTVGRSEQRLAGLAGFDFDWKVFDRLTLTQDANAVAETGGQALVLIDGTNTTLDLTTGVDFAVSDRLRARMSYQLDYDSNPPAGKVSTDTLTRATLIYGF